MTNNNGNIRNISDRIWNLCTVLMNSGVGTQDYLQQLTLLIFLKMADEYSHPPHSRDLGIPKEYTWLILKSKSGTDLEIHYTNTLEALAKKSGMVGFIFARAQNKIQTPALLQRVIEMIDSVSWVGMDVDVKGEIYESLLERVASDTKSGAGQYFTPRPLIHAMIKAVQPEPNKAMVDPACGTGGFFLSFYEYVTKTYQKSLDRVALKFLTEKAFMGWEIVPETARVCAMNMLLHGLANPLSEPPIKPVDSLTMDPGTRYDYVFTNPPFGRSGSYFVATESGELARETPTYNRQDFWASTTNKQLNFVQHIKTLLKVTGRAAVVVPDNVLFEGGAGEIIRRKMLETTDLHTILRLPTGIFYAQGVKANVFFFDNRPASPDPQTKELWVYDLRTNKHFTRIENPLIDNSFDDFLKCYNPDNRYDRKETKLFKRFTLKEILTRDKANLDITWLKDESLEDMDNLPSPDEIGKEIMDDLQAAILLIEQINNGLVHKD